MTTKIRKWGNSLGVRIPKEIAHEMRMREGSAVSFSIKGDGLILSHQKKHTYAIEELVKGITLKNAHKLEEWGADVGREILPPWENK